MTSECPRCGDGFEVPSGGQGAFTSISVSYHDDAREDWAESFCPPCADEMLDDSVPSGVDA